MILPIRQPLRLLLHEVLRSLLGLLLLLLVALGRFRLWLLVQLAA